ncbi:aminomethyltransferase beta-barrel domain-containing protein, partial [Chloroflexota bacterium]
DSNRNSITVGSKEELYSDSCVASSMNWITLPGQEVPISVKARIRYRQNEAEAMITQIDGEKVHVLFKERVMAITPGQIIVFYDGEELIGGGVID